MIWQFLLVLAIAAMLFPWVRRRLATVGGLIIGALVVFLIVVMATSG